MLRELVELDEAGASRHGAAVCQRTAHNVAENLRIAKKVECRHGLGQHGPPRPSEAGNYESDRHLVDSYR
jgi:hypothetical protein